MLDAPRASVEVESYRWQIAVVDAAAIASVLSRNELAASAGMATYFLGAPIVHLGHDRSGRAAASLALRVGLPLVSAYTWVALTPKHEESAMIAAGFGVALGVIFASVLDITAIARPVEVRRIREPTWAPQITMTPQHVGLGVAGRW